MRLGRLGEDLTIVGRWGDTLEAWDEPGLPGDPSLDPHHRPHDAPALGPIVRHLFGGHALPAIAAGGMSLLAAAATLSLVSRDGARPA